MIAIFIITFFAITINRKYEYQAIYQESVQLFEAGHSEAAVSKIKEIPDYKNYKGVPELFMEYDVYSNYEQNLN